MKNSKKSFVLILSVALVGTLTSCNVLFPGVSSDNEGSVNSSSNQDNITKYPGFAETDIPSIPSKTSEYSTIGKVRDSEGIKEMPSLGKTRMLVVPVIVTGYNKEDSDKTGFENGKYNTTILDEKKTVSVDWANLIKEGFKGDSSSTGYESVKSFYEKSSYGKLEIEPFVSQVFSTTKTYSQLVSLIKEDKNNSPKAATDEIVSEVMNYFFKGTNPIYNIADFDSNKDGILDGLWLVYDVPTNVDEKNNNGLFWAFTTAYGKSDVQVSSYCWASKWFLTEGISAKEPYIDANNNLLADSHTFIHETGHMMGLNDYYDTSTDSNRSPAGALLMMDHNVFDQDPYSKYLLGWIDPKHIRLDNFATTLTLEPFEDNGDALVIDLPNNTGWVGEQYLILSYWTPTGLNEKDATNEYHYWDVIASTSTTKNPYAGYTKPGIQMYFVDSRFVKNSFLSSNSSNQIATEEEINNATYNGKDYYVEVFNNDSSVESVIGGVDDVQMQIIDAGNKYRNMYAPKTIGSNSYVTPDQYVAADDSYLFHEGDRYDSSYLGRKEYTLSAYLDVYFHGTDFNPDKTLSTGLRVDFGAQTDKSAILNISKE